MSNSPECAHLDLTFIEYEGLPNDTYLYQCNTCHMFVRLDEKLKK